MSIGVSVRTTKSAARNPQLHIVPSDIAIFESTPKKQRCNTKLEN